MKREARLSACDKMGWAIAESVFHGISTSSTGDLGPTVAAANVVFESAVGPVATDVDEGIKPDGIAAR